MIKADFKRFLIFTTGGVLSALTDVLTTWLLIALNVWYITSVSVGFMASVMFNFTFHAKITFGINTSQSTIFKYGIIVAFNYLLMFVIVITCQHIFFISPLMGKLIAVPIISINGYLWSNYWVFCKSGQGS